MEKEKSLLFVAMKQQKIALIAVERESSSLLKNKNTKKTVEFVMLESVAVADVIFIQKV